jgi:hypothetical protein
VETALTIALLILEVANGSGVPALRSTVPTTNCEVEKSSQIRLTWRRGGFENPDKVDDRKKE